MSTTMTDNWITSPLGEYIMQAERPLFDEAVSAVFGFNAAQMGMLESNLLENVRMPRKLRLSSEAGDVRCESTHLPFANTSLDLLLMPHGLDFSANPQQTLREAERVLLPEGHIMLTGFNPLSVWGINRLLQSPENAPWDGSFFTLMRVKDWLSLLGFDIVSVKMCCFSPPCSKAQWLARFQFLDRTIGNKSSMMGGVYFIVAKKKVIGMRLIRPKWNKTKVKSSLVPTPTQHSILQDDRSNEE